MNLVSFNLFRTLGLPNATFVKPEDLQRLPQVYAPQVQAADWVLFPEYWQLNGILYGLNGRIFPSEASYRVGHNKIEMTRACQLLKPRHLPTTWIESNTAENAEQIWDKMDLPFVAKLPKASQGDGVWLIESRTDWQAYLARTDVLYAQEYLPINKDLRIVIVGDKVLSAYWRLQSDRSFHSNVSRGGRVCLDEVPQNALDFALELAKALNVNHAGFDIAMVGGHPYFLEFNRLFGNQGIPGGGKTITDAILHYLQKHHTEHDPLQPTEPHDVPMIV